MKVLIVLSALIAASYALPTASVKPDPDIINDLKQFEKCLDMTSYEKHINESIQNDPDVQAVLAYLGTSDFKDFVECLDAEPTYLAILKDLEEHGVPAYEFVNAYLKRFHIDPIDQLTKVQGGNRGVGNFTTLMDTLMTDVNDECTKQVFEERLKADPKFQALVDHLKSDEYKQLVVAFKENETVDYIIDAFNQEGLDLAKFVELLKKFYHYDW